MYVVYFISSLGQSIGGIQHLLDDCIVYTREERRGGKKE
jgi:hypothetical protein